MKKGLFIAIEGLSGVGKSTLEKLLCEHYGIEPTGTVPEEFRSARKFLDAQLGFLNARYLLFLAAMIASGEQIKARVKEGELIITESYIYRTIAFHKAMGATVDVILSTDVLTPDLVIYLECQEVERQRRIREREKHRQDQKKKWDALAEQNSASIRQNYTLLPGMVVIDTTNIAEHEVLETAVQLVEKRR